VTPQSLNRYAYTRNNPLRYTDPSGHCEDTPDDDDVDCWQFARKFAQEYSEKGLTYEELSQYTYDQLIRFYNELEREGAKNMMPPSAHGIGVSVDGGVELPLGFVTIKGTFGVEIIFNHESNDVDLFAIAGGKASFSLKEGINTVKRLFNELDNLDDIGKMKAFVKPESFAKAGGTVYVSEYDHLPSNNLARGLNSLTSYTGHYGPYGTSYAHAYNPMNPNGPSATAVGWSPGIGFDLAMDQSTVRYFQLTR